MEVRLGPSEVRLRGASFHTSSLILWQIMLLIWEVKAVLVIWHDVDESVAELGLLQSEHTLVDLLLKDFTSVFVVHELAHSRSQKPLVVELLVFSLCFTFGTVLAFIVSTCASACCWRLLGILGLSSVGLVVQEPVAHELLFDLLHSLVDLGTASFLNDVYPVGCEINLLLSLGAIDVPVLLREVGLRTIATILAAVEAAHAHSVFVQDSESPLRPVVGWKQRVVRVLPLDILDDLLSLCTHVMRVLDHLLEAFDDGDNVHGHTHRHVGLVSWR